MEVVEEVSDNPDELEKNEVFKKFSTFKGVSRAKNYEAYSDDADNEVVLLKKLDGRSCGRKSCFWIGNFLNVFNTRAEKSRFF